MTRRNFTTAIRTARFKLCGGLCESILENGERCAIPLRRGHWQCDHDTADGLLGKPTLENARCLCEDCHARKTKIDVAKIAKAKRIEAAHLGAKLPAARPLQSRGFAKTAKHEKPKLDKLPIPQARSVSGCFKIGER